MILSVCQSRIGISMGGARVGFSFQSQSFKYKKTRRCWNRKIEMQIDEGANVACFLFLMRLPGEVGNLS